jgi:hypothetical protein
MTERDFTSGWGSMRTTRVVISALGLLGLLNGCGDGSAQDALGGGGQAAGGGGQVTAGTSGSGPNVGTAGTMTNQGGTSSTGSSGSSSTGKAGNGAGGTGNGGSGGGASGGTSGGTNHGGTSAGGSASGGAGGGGGTTMNKVFSQCRLHFGTIDEKAKANPALIPELDFFTPGWMGQKDTFDMKYVCDEAKEGAVLGKQVPVIVAYVSAFYVKRHHGGLCDCNDPNCGQMNGRPNDLCNFGSQHIQADLAAIVNVYKSYAQGFAGCYGTTRPIIFEMEPDFYQYTGSSQNDPLTKAEAGMIMSQYVAAIKQYLPNAYLSIDISPWVDDNGATNGKDWYSHFDLSQFTFINTSGGSTQGGDAKIRSANSMTWAGVSKVTGKGILADTGYGVNGMSAGHDAQWDDANNLNNRIADGVLSISQYNPKQDWVNTIKSVRSQLKTPKFCP